MLETRVTIPRNARLANRRWSAAISSPCSRLPRHHHRVTPPPGALTVAEMRKALDAMGVNIPITALAPKQSIELSK